MRKLKGTIVSDKMSKTVVVRVDRLHKHAKYLKYHRISRKLKAHDEKGEYKIGDLVVIQETKPISKDKRWKVVGVVKRALSGDATEEKGGEE